MKGKALFGCFLKNLCQLTCGLQYVAAERVVSAQLQRWQTAAWEWEYVSIGKGAGIRNAELQPQCRMLVLQRKQ